MRSQGVGAGTKVLAASALLAALATPLAPTVARGQTARSPWKYDQDVHVSYEFDDNVREEIVDPVRAQVARLSYRGDLSWGEGSQRLSFNYYGGFKRHFDISDRADRAFDVSSQFVNEGTVGYQRRVGRDLAVTGRVGLKDRHWTDSQFFLLNEDSFRRYSAEAGVIVNLDPVGPDHAARLEIGGRYTDIRFDHLDNFFGNWVEGAHVSLEKDFGPELEARASYAFDRVRYPGRGALEPGDDPTSINGTDRPRQEDHIHDLGAEVDWFGPVGVVASYHLRYNQSNSFGFEYYSHNFGVQVLHHLPWGVLGQAYAQVELRNFVEPVPTGFMGGGSLDIGESQNNVLLLRLVKDITPDYSVEARYARYRNESITLNDFYTKNVFAIGFTYRP